MLALRRMQWSFTLCTLENDDALDECAVFGHRRVTATTFVPGLFTSAIKACVRSDRTRCGRLDGHAVLRIFDRYGLQLPVHTEYEARRKASLSYVRFIDRLRDI